MSSVLIDPPSSVLGAEVGRLLEQHAHVVRHHCERTYQFAAAFARADGVELDDEVLYLGTVLHDVGLTPGGDPSARFEVRGANVVRTMLLDHGMESARVANVWDCIAMHASSALARHKSPETRYSSRGISLDVRGAGAEGLEPEFVRTVLDRWPRHEFPALFSAVLQDEVRAHPDTTRMSWLESIATATVPGFVPTDILTVIHASEAFR
jgi:HD domain